MALGQGQGGGRGSEVRRRRAEIGHPASVFRLPDLNLTSAHHTTNGARLGALFNVLPPPRIVRVMNLKCSRGVYNRSLRAEVRIGWRCRMVMRLCSVRAEFLEAFAEFDFFAGEKVGVESADFPERGGFAKDERAGYPPKACGSPYSKAA